MRINKFKYKEKEGVFVRYEKESKEDKKRFDTIELTSRDEPAEELKGALQAMGKHILDICEMRGVAGEITVLSVSIPYGGDADIPGLVITGLRKLSYSNSPMVINTPCFWTEPFSDYQEGERKNLLSGAALRDLARLLEEVTHYINGRRAQKELDFNQEKTA